MSILDNLPVASIISVAVAIVGGVIAILHPDTLSFQDYCTALGISTGGLGILGYARAQSGKGTR